MKKNQSIALLLISYKSHYLNNPVSNTERRLKINENF